MDDSESEDEVIAKEPVNNSTTDDFQDALFQDFDISDLGNDLLSEEEDVLVADVEITENTVDESPESIPASPVQEPIPEQIEIEQDYEPPPLPKAAKSFKGVCWDLSFEWMRAIYRKVGWEAPLDALNDSTISLGMGTKGAMLLGPPSAGKTTLIAAINRACLIPVESDIDLWWRASGSVEDQKNLTELLDQAIGHILQEIEDVDGKSINATNDYKKYDFMIEGRVKTSHNYNGAKAFKDMKFSFHDGPGGAMFTLNKAVWEGQKSTREAMIREAKEAYTLIFCFDGTQRNARMMQSSLGRVLPLLQHRRNQNYLYPMRVLILLNKVDQVCENFYTRLVNASNGLVKESAITPESIAHDLDPLSMAIECLGYESLKMLRGAMRPDAQLAVGLISTWGFNNDGHPLVNASGRPNVLTLANKTPANEFVSQWRPFGVRDAVIYLAKGRESSTLQIVQPEHFNTDILPPDEYPF